MVTSSSTHSSFTRLFRQLFEKYSHVYTYPMWEEGRGYKWKVATRLDNSFRFLLLQPLEAIERYATSRETYFSWLAGLIDSDGNITTSPSGRNPRVRVILYNNNVKLL